MFGPCGAACEEGFGGEGGVISELREAVEDKGGDVRVVVVLKCGEYGGEDSGVLFAGGEFSEQFEWLGLAKLSADFEEGDALSGGGCGISGDAECFSDGLGLSLAEAECEGSAAGFGESVGKFIGDSGEAASLEGFFEAFEHFVGDGAIGCCFEELGGLHEIGSGAGEGIAFHEPFGDVLGCEGLLPEFGSGEGELEDGFNGCAADLCFEGPPDEERLMEVCGVFVVLQECFEDGECEVGGKPSGGAGDLFACFDIAFATGGLSDCCGEGGANVGRIANEPHCPGADEWVGVLEQFERGVFGESTGGVEGPEEFEGGLSGGSGDLCAEVGNKRGIGTITDQSQGSLAEGFGGAAEGGKEFFRGGLIKRRRGRCAGKIARGESIDASAGFVNTSGIVAAVIDALFVEIGDIDGAIGAGLDIDGAEPGVVSFEYTFDVFGFEGGLPGTDIAEDDLPLEWFNTEQPTAIAFGQSGFFVDDEGVAEAGDAVVFDVFEESKGEGV